MPDAVKAAFDLAWTAVATEAGKEIALIRENAGMEIKLIEQRLKDAMAGINELEIEQQTDAERLEILEGQCHQERELRQQAETAAVGREAGLRATVEEIRQQNADLKKELALAHTEQSAIRTQYGAEIERLTLQIEQDQPKRQQAESQLAMLASQERVAAEQAARCADAVAALSDAKKIIEMELAQVQKELTSAVASLGKSEGTIEALREQLNR